MKTRYAFAIILLLAFAACGKDKFQTVPQIKVKSQNLDVVPFNGNLRVTLEYTDKEGDVDDSLIIVRQRHNVRGPVTMPALPYNIPDFPKFTKGEFQVNFRYFDDLTLALTAIKIPGTNPQKFEPDTMTLKFVARDRAGNKSDTVRTSVIVER